VVNCEADALAIVEAAYASYDPSPHPMDLDAVLTWGRWQDEGRWCDHCNDVFSRDD
jgi:hypothetical protein